MCFVDAANNTGSSSINYSSGIDGCGNGPYIGPVLCKNNYINFLKSSLYYFTKCIKQVQQCRYSINFRFHKCFFQELSPTFVNSLNTVIKIIGNTSGIIVSLCVGQVTYRFSVSTYTYFSLLYRGL